MKRRKILLGGFVLITIILIVAVLLVSNKSKTMSSITSATSGSPSSQNALPVYTTNPIKNASTLEGLTIENLLVENNVDPITKKPVSDHLEFNIKNSSIIKDMSNFEVYYTITDTVTNKREGYYTALSNITLKPGDVKIINFDGLTGGGHYPDNKYSLYHTSTDPLSFDIFVSSQGFKPQEVQIKKSAGGAEKTD